MASKRKTIPYTYLIGWTKHNKWYYGRRASIGVNPSEFWVKYFTSSNYVAEFREQYGEPDIIQIRRTFKTFEACANCEKRVVKKILKENNGRWLNRGYPSGVNRKSKPANNFNPIETEYAELIKALWAQSSSETKKWIMKKIEARKKQNVSD